MRPSPLRSFEVWRSPGGVHSVPALLFLFVANIFLTGLQVLWTGKIVAGIAELLGGGAKKRAD